jgi:hypothetical protein
LFYFSQTERSLPNYLTHTEAPDPVPWANNVTNSALIAELERCPTVFFDKIRNLFNGRHSVHDLLWFFLVQLNILVRILLKMIDDSGPSRRAIPEEHDRGE